MIAVSPPPTVSPLPSDAPPASGRRAHPASTCGAGSLPWTMASNARSTTCDTSADVSAPGGKGARTLCAACQNASCKVRDRPSGFLSPLLDASALACC